MNNSDLMITLKQLGTKLKESWSNLSMNQKVIGSGAMLLVVIAFIILLLNRTSVQPMEVLYADLIQKDAAAIVAKLEEERIPYQLEGRRDHDSGPCKY